MKRRINLFWGCLAALMLVCSLALCFYGAGHGLLFIQTEEKPEETVEAFFAALKQGDYPTAYKCLENYSGLGLENRPVDPQAAQLLTALKESYSFSLLGECRQDGAEAIQRVRVEALDLQAMQNALKTPVTPTDPEESEGEQEQETEEVSALPAVEELLSHKQDYTDVGEYEVRLVYSRDGWRIHLDAPLLNALLGQPGKEAAA